METGWGWRSREEGLDEGRGGGKTTKEPAAAQKAPPERETDPICDAVSDKSRRYQASTVSCVMSQVTGWFRADGRIARDGSGGGPDGIVFWRATASSVGQIRGGQLGFPGRQPKMAVDVGGLAANGGA